MMDNLAKLFLVAAILMMFGVPTADAVDRDAVLLVVAVQVEPGQLDKYVEQVSKFNGIAERVQATARLRIWEADVAGDATGLVIVGVQYPDLAAYAADADKLEADAEWQKLVGGLDDIRKIVSRTMYRELKP
jgi:hypothetical protein